MGRRGAGGGGRRPLRRGPRAGSAQRPARGHAEAGQGRVAAGGGAPPPARTPTWPTSKRSCAAAESPDVARLRRPQPPVVAAPRRRGRPRPRRRARRSWSSTSTPSTRTPRTCADGPVAPRSGWRRSRSGCPALIRRGLGHEGFQGRALLHPGRGALARGERGQRRPRRRLPDRRPGRAGVGWSSPPRAAVLLTIWSTSPAHLDVVDSVRASQAVPVRVAIESTPAASDARSARRPQAFAAVRRGRRCSIWPAAIQSPPGLPPRRAWMTYEGQVAGVQDDVPAQRARSAVVRRLKSLSLTQLEVRRREIADAPRGVVELSSGMQAGRARSRKPSQIRSSPRSPRVRACWRRRCSTTTSRFDLGRPRSTGCRSCAGHRRRWRRCTEAGSWPRSGRADRLPTPWAPAGLHLTGLEGAGEVQTPLTGRPCPLLSYRRPDLVQARQVGRALRAHRPRTPGRGRSIRRHGADLPRPRLCLLIGPSQVLALARFASSLLSASVG